MSVVFAECGRWHNYINANQLQYYVQYHSSNCYEFLAVCLLGLSTLLSAKREGPTSHRSLLSDALPISPNVQYWNLILYKIITTGSEIFLPVLTRSRGRIKKYERKCMDCICFKNVYVLFIISYFACLRASVFLDHYKENIVFLHFLDVNFFLSIDRSAWLYCRILHPEYIAFHKISQSKPFSRSLTFSVWHLFEYKEILFVDIIFPLNVVYSMIRQRGRCSRK